MRLPSHTQDQPNSSRVPRQVRTSLKFGGDEQTKLLVSVRSVAEATVALRAGVDILDVKDPSQGSLGMAATHVIAQVVQTTAQNHAAVPVSMALGEVCQWSRASQVPELPSGICFAKLGLSQLANRSDWSEEWQRVRREFETRSNSRLNWVAVAYADADAAGSPTVAEVIKGAIETDCCGLLIDTWRKNHRTIVDDINVPTLISIADECHAQGLFLALAGKLSCELLPRLTTVAADVLAIRSAACREHERTFEIDADRVEAFRSAMGAASRVRQSMISE